MSNINIDEELTKLEETKELIKQAIIDKGQSVSPSDSFRSYAGKIDNIETGIDTSDATASVGDIAQGETAYVDGQKITGTVLVISADASTGGMFDHLSNGDASLTVVSAFHSDILMRQGSGAVTDVPNSTLANFIGLTPGKLKLGETIIGVTGTLDPGIDTSDATATENDIMQGKTAYVDGVKVTGVRSESTADATATVNDIASGKTAYVDGQKLEGTVPVITTGMTFLTSNVIDTPAISKLALKVNATDRDYLFRSGTYLNLETAYNDIASTIGLTSDKLVQGNTILGINGTYEGIDTSDATATIDDIALNRTAYVKGQKITGTLQVTGNMSIGTNSVEYTEVESPGIEDGDSTIVRTLYTRGTIDNKKIVSANTTIELFTNASNVASAIGLTANKIKKDETILGITGSYEGTGIDTSDATATASDILDGKTAYADGVKLTGIYVPIMTQEEYDSALAKAQLILGGV